MAASGRQTAKLPHPGSSARRKNCCRQPPVKVMERRILKADHLHRSVLLRFVSTHAIAEDVLSMVLEISPLLCPKPTYCFGKSDPPAKKDLRF